MAMMALSSSCSRLTMSLGVPAGASTIVQLSALKPGIASAIGGISGASARRATEVTPSARNFPSLISGSEGAAAANIIETRPATISTTAGAVPL